MKNNALDSLKKKAAKIREFLKERYEINVSHGHSLEIISKSLGFNDWNTCVAKLNNQIENIQIEKDPSSQPVLTVGDMKRVLSSLDDSMTIDADYTFKIKELDLDSIADSKDEIYQEFSLFFDGVNDDIVTFKLKLEHESITSIRFFAPQNDRFMNDLTERLKYNDSINY